MKPSSVTALVLLLQLTLATHAEAQAWDPFPPLPAGEHLAVKPGLDSTAYDNLRGCLRRFDSGIGASYFTAIVDVTSPDGSPSPDRSDAVPYVDSLYQAWLPSGRLDPATHVLTVLSLRNRAIAVHPGKRWVDLGFQGASIQRAIDGSSFGDYARSGDYGLALCDLALTIDLALSDGEVLTSHESGLLQVRGDRQMLVSCDRAPIVNDGRATYELGPMDDGDSIELTCTHAFASLGEPLPTLKGTVAEALQASRAEHQAFLDGGLRLATPDPAVDDLLTGMLTTLAVQTAANGIVSPMHRYTSGWLRDAEGPLRLFLRSGHDGRARTILDATVASLTSRGAIANSFPLSIDVDAVVPPEDPDTFWAQAAFMPGRNAAEAPSYGPILHDRYVRTTGDESILTPARMAFLEQSLVRQDMDSEGRLPFSGDETYRWLMAVTIGETVPEEVGWSAGSSLLLAHAAGRLLDLGGDEALGAIAETARAGAESYTDPEGFVSPIRFFDSGGLFPGPYEDVSTQPLWLSPDAPTDADAANVEVLSGRLMGEDGVLRSNTLGITGMSHGFWLANLAALNHPDLEAAFNGLAAVATPSGHFEEGHGPEGEALSLVHQPDGMGADTVARYRPWEGGDALAGMLRALIGQEGDAREGRLVLAPRLLNRWPSLSAEGLTFAGVRVDLEIEGYDEGQIVRVSRETGHGRTWDLSLSLRAPAGRVFQRVFLDGLPFADLPEAQVVQLPELPMTDAPITITAVYETR